MADAEQSDYFDGRLLVGDCLVTLKTLDDASIDAIVTDPPYGIEFMGKEWDSFKAKKDTETPDKASGQTKTWCSDESSGIGVGGPRFSTQTRTDAVNFQLWFEEVARECLRVLKPGGHMLAFGGTRMYHRMVCAIEDAGFEVRDSIHWTYGSGFPKSLDVSKAIDKRGGTVAGFEAFRDAVRAAMQRNGVSRTTLTKALGNHMLSHYLTAGSQPAVPNFKDYIMIRDTVGLGHDWDHLFAAEAEREVLGKTEATYGYQRDGERWDKDHFITAPATPDAARWQGWGTALKPSHEPIVVARKPLDGTVAATVLAHGTGALNIDGCRVGTPRTGRWPANTVLAHAADCGPDCVPGCPIADLDRQQEGASRFFTTTEWDPQWDTLIYVAKPAKSERWAGLTACKCRARANSPQVCDQDLKAAAPVDADTSPRRATSDSTTTDGSAWSTSSSGKNTTDQSPQVTKSTTSTASNTTTASTTSNSSIPSRTSVSTPAANYGTANGGSPAECADSSSPSDSTTGISVPKGGPSTDAAAPATSPESSPTSSAAAPNVCGECGGLLTHHATVKPVALMRHLVRLVTPPGGVVLDPFLGSGTTAVAAILEGFDWKGCEMTDDYLPIIKGRVEHARTEQAKQSAPVKARTPRKKQAPGQEPLPLPDTA